MCSVVSGGLLLLSVLGKKLFVGSGSILGDLASLADGLLHDSLSTKSGVSDKSLDLGSLVVSLLTSLDFSVDNVSLNVVLLVKSKFLEDVVSSLLSSHSGSFNIRDTFEVGFSFLDNSKVDDGKIGAIDAASNGLSLALSSSSLSVAGAS